MTRRTPTGPERFRRALNAARQLPTTRELSLRIMASTPGADNGLRAASYDAPTRGSNTGLTHPERVAQQRNPELRVDGDKKPKPTATPRPPDGRQDLIDVNRAHRRALDAIAALNAEVRDTGQPDTWADALRDAALLDETVHPDPDDDAPPHDTRTCNCVTRLESAADLGRDVDGWITQFQRAITTLTAIHRRYKPHAPTRWQQYRTAGYRADEVCEIHVALTPPVYKPKHGRAQLCKTCADLTRTAGQRPPTDLIATLETGTQLEYRKARSHWLQSLGVRPETGCA